MRHFILNVINDSEIEAVWICSPSQFHADLTKACAAAGKHLFCEKNPLLTWKNRFKNTKFKFTDDAPKPRIAHILDPSQE
jgi:hypothetical protein